MNQNRYAAPELSRHYTAKEISTMTNGQHGTASVRQHIRNGVRVAGYVWNEVERNPEPEFVNDFPVMPREALYYTPRVRCCDADTQCINPHAHIAGDPFWHVFPETDSPETHPLVVEAKKQINLETWDNMVAHFDNSLQL